MTLVTIHAVVDIPADVGVIEIGSIVSTVTTCALEDRVVTRVGVAGRAHAVCVPVSQAEPGVIERRTCPSRGCVASGASRREPGGSVIRIRGPVVIRLMAANTGGRQGGVVVVHVTHHARDGGSRVITSERERRVVVVERSPGPIRCAVAHVTGGGESRRRMCWRIGAVVVRLVARNARGIGASQGVVAVHVALAARHREVEARQHKSSGRVVECAATPVGRGVALIASLREARLRVVWSRGALVILQVALDAGSARQVIRVVHVALGAGQTGVEPGQRESSGRVIPSRGGPVGRTVALLTSLRKTGGGVRRRIRTLVVRRVATDTRSICRREIVVAIHVTLGALQRGVRAGQRESRGRVIERRIAPRRGGVALLASLRDVRGHVIRIGGALEIGEVAADASGIRRGQVVIPIDVTLGALQCGVRTGQRESSRRVIERRIAPRRGGVALLASLRDVRGHVIRIGGALEIGEVAADASGVRHGQVVVAIHVTLGALQRSVRSGQRESRGRVIEGGIAPRRGGVALLAGLREARSHVVRIGGALEIREVAADASGVRRGQVVVAVHMALGALQTGVRASQRESRRRVIEARIPPVSCVVALLASLRDVRGNVIRTRRALEILQVAVDAGCAGQVVIVIDVALGALHCGMRPGQRESRVVVIERCLSPRRGVVALLAGLREARTHVVWIRGALEILQVAVDAGGVRARQVVIVVYVTLGALHRGVRAGQREPCRGVIETRVSP